MPYAALIFKLYAFECDACSAVQVHASYSLSDRSYVVMASNILPSYRMDDRTLELKVGTSAVVTGHGALKVIGRGLISNHHVLMLTTLLPELDFRAV